MNTHFIKPIAWWNCDQPSPCPHELFAFAAVHMPSELALATRAQLDRVVEAYIRHARQIGYWPFFSSRVAYHAAGEEGYRDRVAEYRRALACYFRQARAKQ